MWKARSIQVGWFVTNSSDVPVEKLFEALTDQEPDSYMKNRVPSPQNPFLSSATGLSDNEKNTVRVEPGRVNWFVEPKLIESDPPYSKLLEIKPTLGEIRNSILKLDSKLLGETTRLTIVSTFVFPVTSLDSANRKLAKMCELSLTPKGLNDLFIRLNRRKMLRKGEEINRVASYSIETSSLVMQNIQTGNTVKTHNRFAVKVQSDFNTVPKGRVYNIEMQQDILQILMNETLAFADNPTIGYFNV